ncbi:aminoglycoside phosphotransferase family protein [Phytomonospora sp. NPDC050363]|uniref:aminoglycoside phosphotransferase family protein n=1 Tax=Phytomonospora sp. NPDC050363 TaxID=3155642 RepID=UPI0033DB1C15
MADHGVSVPDDVRESILRILGDSAWLDALPATVAGLCEKWGLTLDGPAMSGGTHSYAAPVRRLADGGKAVLKVTVADEENAAEPSALRCYDGDGAVRLHEFDPASAALLIERAEPGNPLVDETDRLGAVEVAAGLLRRLWRVPGEPPTGFPAFPAVSGLIEGWSRTFPARGTAPGGEAVAGKLVARGVELLAAHAVPDGPVGLVNRDAHLGNFLAAGREPWLLIDPKPLLGERAFDAGYLIARQVADRPETPFAWEIVTRVADGLGVDRGRACGWAFIRAVDTALWMSTSGAADHWFAKAFLAAAETLYPLIKD